MSGKCKEYRHLEIDELLSADQLATEKENLVKDDISIGKKDLDLLYDVVASIHAIHNLEKLLQKVLAKVKEVFQIEGASIALHDDLAKEFYFIRTVEEQKGGGGKASDQMRFADDYGIAGWILKNQQSVLIEDVSRDQRFTQELSIQKNLQTNSMICVPLKTDKVFLGVLYAINSLAEPFTSKSLHLLEILSSTIALAIENARLYGELQNRTKALESENLRLQLELQDRFNKQGIIASSAAMQKVFMLLNKVMTTTITVLIQGETGTGKELIARAIHFNGTLKNRPFMVENCAALSDGLLESELFGHVRGAFTGAIADKKGLFELANGGTIFLDEIGEMSPAMQVKILRVLQEGEVRPVGGSSFKKVKFRFISATNRDLYEEVQKGRFREDLFYRIQAFPIQLPPLRERREDIALLATHFLEQYSTEFNRSGVRLTPGVLDLLSRYRWPGNIRELEHEIERLLTLSVSGEEIRIEYLSDRIKGTERQIDADDKVSGNLSEAVARLEKNMVVDALEQTHGNRSQAANLLGLTRQGLHNKISRYAIKL